MVILADRRPTRIWIKWMEESVSQVRNKFSFFPSSLETEFYSMLSGCCRQRRGLLEEKSELPSVRPPPPTAVGQRDNGAAESPPTNTATSSSRFHSSLFPLSPTRTPTPKPSPTALRPPPAPQPLVLLCHINLLFRHHWAQSYHLRSQRAASNEPRAEAT